MNPLKHFILLLPAVFLSAGCKTSSEEPGAALPTTQSSWDFGKSNLMTAPVALEKALQQYEEKYGLAGRFRIDMRRMQGGWYIEFVRIPESPDQWSTVEVYDDGRVQRTR